MNGARFALFGIVVGLSVLVPQCVGCIGDSVSYRNARTGTVVTVERGEADPAPVASSVVVDGEELRKVE